MENTALVQLCPFLMYVTSGIIIGIFFDIFRILRKSFPTPDLLTAIEDIVFWLITGLFLLFVLFRISNGEIRLYNIMALLIGGIFYLLTMSKMFIKINVKIVVFIKNLFYKIFLLPLKAILSVGKKLFTPFTFFVINVKRRILERNVEKYN